MTAVYLPKRVADDFVKKARKGRIYAPKKLLSPFGSGVPVPFFEQVWAGMPLDDVRLDI